MLFFILTLFLSFRCVCDGKVAHQFPAGFKFGVATAAYQVEGAWNENGKGENIWDWFTHTKPEAIADRLNGDIACDSYHKTEEDVKLLKNINVNYYRFSLSWARLLPTGYVATVNPDGVRYYNDLIDKLLASDIKPMVTLYHWDLPMPLHLLGGWPNSQLADIFVDYADKVFQLFGDRVTDWITFNEPHQICEFGYGLGALAPGNKEQGIGNYLCGHTLLLAHGKAYQLYNKTYRPDQKGNISITIHSAWIEPTTNSSEDKEAAKLKIQTELGIYAHPIFSNTGNYPPDVIKRINANSIKEGFAKSRLPVFTDTEIKMLIGSSDFFGLNHYTTFLCSPLEGNKVVRPSYTFDAGADCHQPSDWKATGSVWLKVVPWGLRKLLKWIKEEYNNPAVMVTENGYSDNKGNINDCRRVDYYNSYLSELLKAIHEDGCNVTAYTAWSFMDNFEWTSGYSEKFGIHKVDFNHPDRPRTPKMSAHVFKNIIKTRKIDLNYKPEGFGECDDQDTIPDKPPESSSNFVIPNLYKFTILFAYLLVF